MQEIVEYMDGWAMLKNGVEIIFYNKLTDTYTFNNCGSINCAVVHSEDLEWFRDFLH